MMGVGMLSCKKASERSCWKSYGDEAELEYPISEVDSITLLKNIKYRIYQDSLNKVVVKGGENVVGLVEVVQEGGHLKVSNENSCNFLRDSDKKIEVEIHYPEYNRIYCEPSDSVVFEDTITGDSLFFEMRNGGGSGILNVNVNFIRINVSFGTGDYRLSGQADHAELKVQNNGFADCRDFLADFVFVHSVSTADLYVNLQGSSVLMDIQGTGNVYYIGDYNAISNTSSGSGELIKL